MSTEITIVVSLTIVCLALIIITKILVEDGKNYESLYEIKNTFYKSLDIMQKDIADIKKEFNSHI